MTGAITIDGDTYHLRGTVVSKANGDGIAGLDVYVYDKDFILRDDFLGIAVTGPDGAFSVTFSTSDFREWFLDRKPDLYFVVEDGGLVLIDTKSTPITHAGDSTPPIVLTVDLADDKLRQDINTVPAPGWVGGFEASNPAFAYPDPDLSSLPMLGNLDNIDSITRQQKVLWPEFSWETEPGTADSRCYSMFAPDISRLGYDDHGRVWAIICPQQGACAPEIGCLNVEVTVTGTRGWADESTRTLAADMTVTGKIWFSPSAHENPLVNDLWDHFRENDRPFPFDKAHAIEVTTFNPGEPDQPIFPLGRGQSDSFPIPNFARHDTIAWTVGNLGVEIGPITKTGDDVVDAFNQTIMDIFNLASGNMLKDGNTLTWNVWFTAPELVDQTEWRDHAEKWRTSIDADHGSPDGPATAPKFFNGEPFHAADELFSELLGALKALL